MLQLLVSNDHLLLSWKSLNVHYYTTSTSLPSIQGSTGWIKKVRLFSAR